MTVTIKFDTGTAGMKFVYKLVGKYFVMYSFYEEDNKFVFDEAPRSLVNELMDELYNGKLIFSIIVDKDE